MLQCCPCPRGQLSCWVLSCEVVNCKVNCVLFVCLSTALPAMGCPHIVLAGSLIAQRVCQLYDSQLDYSWLLVVLLTLFVGQCVPPRVACQVS